MKGAVTSEAVFSGAAFVHGEALGEIIASNVELSFWGGVDPFSSEVIDRHHPLSGQILTGKILVIPGGRGSCSGSGVILELLLTGKGPAARVVERLRIEKSAYRSLAVTVRATRPDRVSRPLSSSAIRRSSAWSGPAP